MSETTKPAAKKAPKASSNGTELRPLQIKVLQLLNKKGVALTRAKMYDALKFKANSGLNDVLGKNDPKARAKADKEKYPCLLTLGAINMDSIGGGETGEPKETVYTITGKGRQMLAKVK